MTPTSIIDREFPGAITDEQFVRRTVELLTPYGFDAHNTIACVGLCRDELARPLATRITTTWGEAFNFCSLAGQYTLGRTGFAAARSHSPLVGGRERFVFVSMPHIGVDRDGTIGMVQRRGQGIATPTCGALAATAQLLAAGGGSGELDMDDLEVSLLVRRLEPLALGANLTELTRIARRAFLEDLQRLIAGSDMTGVDYAVFSGIQIHAPDAEFVWIADAYAVVDGMQTPLQVT